MASNGISDLVGSRILVIDHDAESRDFMCDQLGDLGFTMRGAVDGIDGLRAALGLPRPDLIITNVDLPRLSGLDVIRRLRTRGNWVRIIIATEKADDCVHLAAIEHAVLDIMAKPFTDETLHRRVIAALRRVMVKKSVYRYRDLELDLVTRCATRGRRAIQLSPAECPLLHYFLEHPEVPLSNERLREEVLGDRSGPRGNDCALLPRISRLRQKLHGPDEEPILHTVPSMGYMLALPDADDPTLEGLGDLPWPGSFDQFTSGEEEEKEEGA